MSRATALRLAARYGFVLDESVSGRVGDSYSVTLDHPTHSIGGDCRSIHVSDYGNALRSASACAWEEVAERVCSEGPLLEPCTDPECEYHNGD